MICILVTEEKKKKKEALNILEDVIQLEKRVGLHIYCL